MESDGSANAHACRDLRIGVQHTRGALFMADDASDGVLCDAPEGPTGDPARVGALTNQPWSHATISA